MLSARGAGGVAIAAGFGWLSVAWAGFGKRTWSSADDAEAIAGQDAGGVGEQGDRASVCEVRPPWRYRLGDVIDREQRRLLEQQRKLGGEPGVVEASDAGRWCAGQG